MPAQPLILFDGICNLCNGAVQFVIRHDGKALFQFAPLQSNAGQEILAKFSLSKQDFDSFVLLENNKAYKKSTAALKVARRLDGPVKMLYGFIIVPVFIRDAVYSWIAKNRYRWFGRKDSCMVPQPGIVSRFLK
ncbi:MAG: hypothetical protein JWQ27_1061 [Ferruginibacter sp.]|nr:hypothetical protein [Ferruginibacter sp.]